MTDQIGVIDIFPTGNHLLGDHRVSEDVPAASRPLGLDLSLEQVAQGLEVTFHDPFQVYRIEGYNQHDVKTDLRMPSHPSIGPKSVVIPAHHYLNVHTVDVDRYVQISL